LQGIESDEALAEKLWESLQAKLAAYDVILGRQKYLAGEVCGGYIVLSPPIC